MKAMLLPALAFGPFLAAVPGYIIGKRNKRARDAFVCCVLCAELALAVCALQLQLAGESLAYAWEGFCGMGLMLGLDGFRAVYVCICAGMFAVTGIFSGDYFEKHYHNRNRYYFFTLLTLGGTVGMLLSTSLYSAFIFFEIMSFASYAWVAHDEKPGALRAAQTYLAVAVIGGMVTLMGLFLVYARIGTLEIAKLSTLSQACASKKELYTICALCCVGFVAKAGAFPAHIWLPKAHPVAPAPSSALLSGMLTKCGVFGILIVSCEVFAGDVLWGTALFRLGEITMVLGAVLALFSVDLKRTLACSSMSQIGFILIGVGCRCILGEHGATAGIGTVAHMANHSLCKLVLFQCAGAVYMRLHKLNLNDIRGFGRKKPILHIAFLLGALGLAGMPLLNGYLSKSLLHEGIVEILHEGGLAAIFRIDEWVFLVSGGMTAAYMTKLYVCLFLEKNADPAVQKKYDEMGRFGWKTNAAIGLSALLLPLCGMLPALTLEKIGTLSLPFMHLHAHGGAIAWFSAENLQGAAISLSIGAVLYFAFERTVLLREGNYVNRWPRKLDMEDGLYRPLLEKLLPGALGFVCRVGDNLLEFVLLHILRPLAALATRAADTAADSAAVLLIDTVFRKPKTERRPIVGNRFTHACGTVANAIAHLLNVGILREHPIDTDYIALFAAWRDAIGETRMRVTRSVSFGLLLLCLTIYCIFAVLLR